MLLFLLILFIIFILWPICRAALLVYRLRRQARQAFEQFGRQQKEQHRQNESANRPAGWKSAPHRRKIINPDQGEYVEWEEVTVVSAETTGTSDSGAATEHNRGTSVVEEQRITDAEWEEIDSVK